MKPVHDPSVAKQNNGAQTEAEVLMPGAVREKYSVDPALSNALKANIARRKQQSRSRENDSKTCLKTGDGLR